MRTLYPQLERAEVIVPGSTANIGLYFDAAGAALNDPRLAVGLERISGDEIELEVNTSAPTPAGRERGYAGVVALREYLGRIGAYTGVRLTYNDMNEEGFRTGGTGLSGAEGAGAVMAAAMLFGQEIRKEEAVEVAAWGEPAMHKDNVAPSILGGIIFLARESNSSETFFRKVAVPEKLGLAIGFSSHQKTGGTKAARTALQSPVPISDYIDQVGRATVTALALQQGDVQTFIRMVGKDVFHEPRRAEAGVYGNFSHIELGRIKEELLATHGVGLAISGAGPNMQLWYDRSRLTDLTPLAEQVRELFKPHGITMKVRDVGVNPVGAYDDAHARYRTSL